MLQSPVLSLLFLVTATYQQGFNFNTQGTRQMNQEPLRSPTSSSLRFPRSFRFPSSRAADSNCLTAAGERGTCINIKECPRMLDILVSQRDNASAISYLRGSLCGYNKADPKLCCPSEESTSEENNLSNLLEPPHCGKSATLDLPRIVGGRPAELGSWPWITALGYGSRGNSKISWICGGALVSDQFVVTAAHCTKHPRLILMKVRVGDLDLDEKVEDGASPQDIDVDKVIAHENYSKTKFYNDIAIVKLSEKAKLNNLVQPICLPKNPEMRRNGFVNYNPFVAGWGSVMFRGPSAKHLQEIQLPVLDNEVCKEAYRPKKAEIVDTQMCVGYVKGGRDACQGDSGGPLMLPQGESFYLIGVVSFGYRCAEKGFPGIYTRVTDFIPWIADKMKELS